jgi:hypothetical protein
MRRRETFGANTGPDKTRWDRRRWQERQRSVRQRSMGRTAGERAPPPRGKEERASLSGTAHRYQMKNPMPPVTLELHI